MLDLAQIKLTQPGGRRKIRAEYFIPEGWRYEARALGFVYWAREWGAKYILGEIRGGKNPTIEICAWEGHHGIVGEGQYLATLRADGILYLDFPAMRQCLTHIYDPLPRLAVKKILADPLREIFLIHVHGRGAFRLSVAEWGNAICGQYKGDLLGLGIQTVDARQARF